MENLDSLKGKNIQYYVIDAGWYANQHGWEKSHEDWQFNHEQFPNGLKTVIEEIKKNNMVPGIWFEI
ncbi:alpha-galactosidase [Enterococcus florum]|uniref:alpha-galactosidase n=1 Tax=Enterococcus florum TaxID=2480627 RepID=UPI00158C4AA4